MTSVKLRVSELKSRNQKYSKNQQLHNTIKWTWLSLAYPEELDKSPQALHSENKIK